MTANRDELMHLIEGLPDGQVKVVLADVRRLAANGAVDVREAEVSANSMHGDVHRRGHQPLFAEVPDEELGVGALDSDERIEVVGFAPTEPAPQLGRNIVWVAPVYRARNETAVS